MNGAGKAELGVSWERYAQRVEELIKDKGVFKHCTAIAFAALVPLAALGGAVRQASAALVIFAVAFPKSIAGLVGLDNKFPETYTMRQVGFRIVKMLAHAKVAAKTTAYFPVVFVYPKTVVKEYRTLRSDPLNVPAPSTHTPVEPPLPEETSAKPFLKTPSASTVERIKEWIGAHPTYSTIGLGIAAVGALALAGYGISILVSGDQVATNLDVFDPYGQAANKSEAESFENIFQGNSHQTTTNLTDLSLSGQNSDINSGLSTGISLDVLGTDGASSDELSLVALEGEGNDFSGQLPLNIAAATQPVRDSDATIFPHTPLDFAQNIDHTNFIQKQGNGTVSITNSHVFNPYGQAANNLDAESFQNILQGNSHQITTNLTDPSLSGHNSDINSGLSTGISLDVLGTDGASSDESSLVALKGEGNDVSDQLIGGSDPIIWSDTASADNTDFTQNEGNGAVTIATPNSVSGRSANLQITKSNPLLSEIIRLGLSEAHGVPIDQSTTVTDEAASNRMETAPLIGDISEKGSLSIVSETATPTPSETATATPSGIVSKEHDPSDLGGKKNQTTTLTSAITSITPSPSIIISPKAMGPIEKAQSQTNDEGASTSWMPIVGSISAIFAGVLSFNWIRKSKGSPANSKILPANPVDVANQTERVSSFKKKALESLNSNQVVPCNGRGLSLAQILLLKAASCPQAESDEFVTILNEGNQRVIQLTSVTQYVFKPMPLWRAQRAENLANEGREVVKNYKLHLLKVPHASIACEIDDENVILMLEKGDLIASTYHDVQCIYTHLWQDPSMHQYMNRLFNQLILFISKTKFSRVRYDNIPFTKQGRVALFNLDSASSLDGLTTGGDVEKNDGILNYVSSTFLEEQFAEAVHRCNDSVDELRNRKSGIQEHQKAVEEDQKKYEEFANGNSLTCSSQEISPRAAELFKGNQAKLAKVIIEMLNKQVAKSEGFTKRSGRKLSLDLDDAPNSLYADYGTVLYKTHPAFRESCLQILKKLKDDGFVYKVEEYGHKPNLIEVFY